MTSPTPARASLSEARRLLVHARPYRRRLAAATACLLLGGALGLVYPRVFGELVDAAFTTHDPGALGRLSAILLAVFFVQAACSFLRRYLLGWVGQRVVADLRVVLCRHLVHLPQAYFHRRRSGELVSRLSADVTKVEQMVSSGIADVVLNLVTVIGGVTILLVGHPGLTLVMLLAIPPAVGLALVGGRRIRRIATRGQDALADATAKLQEGLGGIETVQSFARENHLVSHYAAAVERTFDLGRREALATGWLSAGVQLGAGLTVCIILWLGGSMVAQGTMTAGRLTEFALYTSIMVMAITPLAWLWGRMQVTLGATERLFEILDTPRGLTSPTAPRAVPPIRGELRLHDVTFAYDDRQSAVLQHVDLHLRPGRSCALVGSSGSGKSTITRLIRRLYDPSDGHITLDGHDLRDLELGAVRRSMAIVSQDPVLFSGTIADNIRYGRLEATDAEVEDAARQANAHEFIRSFPAGYQTRVGERGVQLSGGQRQRISIARAILADPRVLLLDEATSALDAHSERLVQDALRTLRPGRTTIIIAHRLSTVIDADHIAVLEEGRIVEEGRHHELLARRGAYARLVGRQAAANDDASRQPAACATG